MTIESSSSTSSGSSTSSSTATNTTTTSPPLQAPSATNDAAYELLLKQYAATQKPQSTAQIKAAGEVKTRLGIIWFVGVVCVLLIIIGGAATFKDPTTAKDVWVIIGPMISSAITGTVAYFTGEKNSSAK